MSLSRIGIPVVVAALASLTSPLRGQAIEQWYVTPAAGTSTQRFGLAMVVEGGLMVVGAPYEDTLGVDAGAVDVYRWDAAANSWAFEQQLFASDAEAGARFGSAVAVDGNVMAVGSPFKDTTAGADAGQLYVFRYDSTNHVWNEEQKLKSSVALTNDQLGTAVDISGNVVVAGAPKADTASGVDSGVAVVYRYKNSIVKWVEEKQLVDADAAGGDAAGTSVAVSGSTAFVASPASLESNQYVAGSIAVWSYAASTWSQTQEIVAPTPQGYSYFGTRLKLNGDVLGVSAPAEDETSLVYDSGAAYVYRLVNGSWTFEARFTKPTPLAGEGFGTDLAIEGDLVAVGAQNQDVASKGDCGAVHVFRQRRNGAWVYDQQLGASDFATTDHLGAQVEIDGEQILVAADGNDTTPGYDWGVVYGYVTSEIVLSITPPDPQPDETVTFVAFRGTPDDLCMVTIEDVSGTPLFLPLLVYVFAADHTLTFTADAPNPAYGLHVGMRAWKISPTGPVVFSELAYLDV